jgi:hypothetical protein
MPAIKALGATVTYDDQQVQIKHSMGMGTVTVPISHVLGVDLQDPSLFKIGHLEIRALGASHRGKMPTNPLRVTFGKHQQAEIHVLYDLLISRTMLPRQ